MGALNAFQDKAGTVLVFDRNRSSLPVVKNFFFFFFFFFNKTEEEKKIICAVHWLSLRVVENYDKATYVGLLRLVQPCGHKGL